MSRSFLALMMDIESETRKLPSINWVPRALSSSSKHVMFCITLVLLFIIRIRFPSGTPISTIIRKRYGDHVLKSYRKLETLIFKREKCILDKIFLNECKKNNLIPKYNSVDIIFLWHFSSICNSNNISSLNPKSNWRFVIFTT